MDASFLYQCKHCKKRFLKERFFMTHECKEMIRAREIQGSQGQQAYQLYKLWLEKQKRKPPPIETFITSAYYTSFYRFAKLTQDLSIKDPELFVTIMAKDGISPALWVRDECYQEYVEHLEKKSDPYKQAELTFNEIFSLSDKLGCAPGEVFAKLHHGEIIELLNKRLLSPWVLFCSVKFKERMAKLDEHDRTFIMKLLGVTYWAHAFEQKPDVVKDMRMLVAEVGL